MNSYVHTCKHYTSCVEWKRKPFSAKRTCDSTDRLHSLPSHDP
jgi:hypothetical protein